MNRCAICFTHTLSTLCGGCQSLLTPIEFPCQHCAKPLNQIDGICGECRADPPGFTKTYSATVYQPPASLWVQQLKFGERLDRAAVMAEAMLPMLSEVSQEVPILPMPLHRKRLQSRGYNQAYEVAKIISQKQRRVLLSDTLIRVKHTAMQAELHEKQRAANVRSAFRLKQEISHDCVLVLDDVMTTGQTMRSVARCLLKAGVQEVQVAVFARSKGL